MESIDKPLVELFTKLSSNTLKLDIAQKVLAMVQALEKGSQAEADKIQMDLTMNHWDTDQAWIKGLKPLLATAKAKGLQRERETSR
eukprot:TRINITY_DN880_c0_g1_i1.p3 TRINITY_DN880_c0_g1~~TRINITY_DN880_c0_g1_i1.p3  ORF type:complete len:86 (+),score=33.14 TRINITY_DN880_c0_g1_i1:151-408(+)